MANGLGCPSCQEFRTIVTRSWIVGTTGNRHRRRECAACGFRFTTVERPVVSVTVQHD